MTTETKARPRPARATRAPRTTRAKQSDRAQDIPARVAAPRQSGSAPRAISLSSQRARQMRHRIAYGLGACAVTVTALSLTHLASGISAVTHASRPEGWAMAIGIDVAMIGAELALISTQRASGASGTAIAKRVARYARPFTIGALVASGALNCMAFLAGAAGVLGQGVAIAAGCAIPAMVYCLTQICTALVLD